MARLASLALLALTCARFAAAQCAACTVPSIGGSPRVYSIRPADLESGFSDTAYAVATADFNSDGIPDLAVGTGFKLTILLGTGGGGFAPPIFIDQGFVSGSTVIADDFDGDGNQDVLVAGARLYFGDGEGGFQPPLAVSAGSGDVVAADFDGDGILDLALVESGGVVIMRGLAAGHFVVTGKMAFPSEFLHLAAGDLNGDGIADLVVGDESDGNVSVFLGQLGAALPVLVGSTHVADKALTIAIGDLNGDGQPDLVAAGFNWYGEFIQSISVLFGNGDGSFALPVPYQNPAGASGIAIADLDGDGHLDVAISGNGGLEIHRNDGQGGLLPGAVRLTGDQGIGIAAADFDGDGRPDLAIAGGYDDDIFVFLTRSDGEPEELPWVDSGAGAKSLSVIDMDGNGTLDVVLSNWWSRDISILPGNGDGTFGPRHAFSTDTPYGAAAVGDVNGDGKPDVVASSDGYEQFFVSLNLGANELALPTTVESLRGIEPISLVDLDGDGHLDLIASSDTVDLIHFGDGAGGFGPPVPIPGTGPDPGAVADLNADGKPDLVLLHSNGGTVELWVLLGQGGGAFASPLASEVPGGEPIILADGNGDGKLDVILGGSYPNGFYLLAGDGTGALGSPVFFQTLHEPRDLAVADLNGDGIADVVLASGQRTTVSVRPGTGGGGFGPEVSFATPVTPQFVGAGDLDGDGKTDLVAVGGWSQYGDDRLTVLRNSRCEPARLAISASPSRCIHKGEAFSQQPAVRVIDAGGNTVSCAGGVVQASIVPGTGPAGATLGGQTAVPVVNGVASFANLSIDLAGTGYVLGYSHPAASTRSGVFAVANGDPPAPTVSNSGPFCSGETLNLYATTVPGAIYHWSGPNGFSSAEQSPSIPQAPAQAAGTYAVTATVDGCTSAAATTVVTVSPPPPGPSITGHTTVCDRARLLLTASGGAPSYQWYFNGQPLAGASGADYTIDAAGTEDAGQYTVTSISAGGCISLASDPVTVSIIEGCAITAMGLEVDPTTGSPSNANGIVEPGETVLVVPTWRDALPTAISLTSTASNLTGPGPATYTIVDSTADYGSFPPVATKNCLDATGNCFAVSITAATRPRLHWDARMDEVPSTGDPTRSWTLHVGSSFSDVDVASDFYPYIETVLHNEVTAGCDISTYCPNGTVTRAQMAVFLLKAGHGPGYSPPPASGLLFTDVPPQSFAADWIEELYMEGITAGCGGSNFCPNDPVRRDQMAVFLLKGEHGGYYYAPPPCTGIFTDVACSPTPDFAVKWIEQLYNEGITGGCSLKILSYCPAGASTREQMAAFLVKTFGLVLYGP